MGGGTWCTVEPAKYQYLVSFFQPQEIDALVGEDRQTLCTRGLTLGSQKCSVIRDRFSESSDCTMDIRTKSQGGEPTYNISVGKAGTGNCVGKRSPWRTEVDNVNLKQCLKGLLSFKLGLADGFFSLGGPEWVNLSVSLCSFYLSRESCTLNEFFQTFLLFFNLSSVSLCSRGGIKL